MTNYTLEKFSVNNKTLFEEIHKFVEEGITSGEVMWSSEIHRISFVEIIENLLDDLEYDDRITQSNVICDYRNNNTLDMDNGKYTLEIFYKQRNCLNTTKLVYHIMEPNSVKSEMDTVDFSI